MKLTRMKKKRELTINPNLEFLNFSCCITLQTPAFNPYSSTLCHINDTRIKTFKIPNCNAPKWL